MTRFLSKIGQFYKVLSFSKTSFILSASTLQNSLVVIVLLDICPSNVWYTSGVTFPNKVRFGHCI